MRNWTILNNWTYDGKEVIVPPEGMVGFVYLITRNDTGKSYIGKKSFWSHRTKKVVGRKNRKHTIKESDWTTYWSSSDQIKEEVKTLGEDAFTRKILRFYKSKKELTYGELEYQVKLDVLTAKLPDGSRKFYNSTILGKFFA